MNHGVRAMNMTHRMKIYSDLLIQQVISAFWRYIIPAKENAILSRRQAFVFKHK